MLEFTPSCICVCVCVCVCVFGGGGGDFIRGLFFAFVFFGGGGGGGLWWWGGGGGGGGFYTGFDLHLVLFYLTTTTLSNFIHYFAQMD